MKSFCSKVLIKIFSMEFFLKAKIVFKDSTVQFSLKIKKYKFLHM